MSGSVDVKLLVSPWAEEVRGWLAHDSLFAVVDPAVEARFGIVDALRARHPGTTVTDFSRFAPNPTWEQLQRAVSAAASAEATAILAVGGGTAIDLAKLTAAALEAGGVEALWSAAQSGDGLAIARARIGLMAVPTTAGTGAEATRFAVLYRDGIKHSVAGNALLPDAWALDPSLLSSLPPAVIADAGLDAACQAMESLWSVRCSPDSEREAWAALDLVVRHLEPAVGAASRDAPAGMLVAAHLAGRAINRTTTTAPHALSYGLTTLLGVPHGRAVAILFGPIFELNAGVAPENCAQAGGPRHVRDRLAEIAARWGQTRESFPSWWRQLLRDRLCIPPLVVPCEKLPILAATVNPARLANNPRRLAAAEIRTVYQDLLA